MDGLLATIGQSGYAGQPVACHDGERGDSGSAYRGRGQCDDGRSWAGAY